MTKDMTVGSPARLLLAFSIPLLLGNIFQQLYNMVDTIVVGRGIGVSALAAVGSTGSINFLILGFVTGLTQGFSILISHAFGANDYQRMRRVYTMSVFISLITSIVITILSVWGAYWLLDVMNTPADIIDDAVLYIRIIFAGMIITIFFNLYSSVLRALGDSKTPLYAMIVSSIINIVLDILFVVYLHMGVAGAAWATLIAQATSVLFCFLRLRQIDILRPEKADWRYESSITFDLVKLGFPVACMNSVTAAGVMILQLMVNGFGSIYVAAYSAACKIMGVVEQPGVTFGFAMATFVGQNLGAGNIKRIKEGIRKCIMLSLGLYVFIIAALILFGKPLIAMIVTQSETQVINIAYEYIFITSLFLGVLALLFIYRSSLQGMGDTVIPMISGGVEFGARILVALFLPALVGFTAIPLAEAAAWVGAEVLLMVFFYRRLRHLGKKDDASIPLSTLEA